MAQENVSEVMLLDGARMLLSTVLAGIMGFLKEQNIPIKDWVCYTGEKLADSMGRLEGKGADLAMRRLLVLQILPAGSQVVVGVFTAEKAEVTVTPLPSGAVLGKFRTNPGELLRTFGITLKDFESIHGLYGPAMAAIGLHLEHRLAGGQEVVSLVQASGGSAPDPCGGAGKP
ncbi:MAG: hypothetical protein HY673_12890 [Chloroflexi bacterium]|nr:hypothetical protein [Chloroflexota bacterium]